MARSWRAITVPAEEGAQPADLAIPVGASFAFDPRADGLAGIYAARVLDRGLDPRALCAEVRADRRGTPEQSAAPRALVRHPRLSRFGRGTAAHLQATAQLAARITPREVPGSRRVTTIETGRSSRANWPRRLAATGLGLLLLLPLTALI